MMSSPKQLNYWLSHSGFTLIELLVVMVILGITSSLLAPDMFDLVDRSRAKAELEKIKGVSELSVERSFFSGKDIFIHFKDNTVTFSHKEITEQDADTLKVIESEYFTFKETKISIENGVWQGVNQVSLAKSPGNNLKKLMLRELNDNSLAGSSASNELDEEYEE